MTAPVIATLGDDYSSDNSNPTTKPLFDGSYVPSGIEEGDLLVAVILTCQVDPSTHSAPAGWTQQANPSHDAGDNALRLSVWTKIATSNEPSSYQFSVTGGSGNAFNTITGKMIRITGAHQTDYVNVVGTQSAVATSPIVVAGVDTTVNDCLVLYILGQGKAGSGSISATPPGDLTEQWDFWVDTIGDGGQAAATKVQSGAGDTGDKSFTHGSVSSNVAVTIAIAPVEIETSGLTAGTEAADQTSYTTASITPTHRALILCSVLNTKASSANAPTVTGCNLTWVQVDSVPFGSNDSFRLTLFRAMSPANSPPTTGVLTIAFGGVAQTGCSWAVNEFSGVDTGGSNGSRAIRNERDNESTGTGTTLTVTLPQISSPNNVVFGTFGFIDNAAVSPGTGFTEIAEVQDTTPDRTLFTEFQQGRDRTVDATGPSVAASGIAGIAVEIRATSTITQAGLASGTDPTLRSSYTTDSITPSADSLILLAVYNSRSNTATVPTVSGCSLTWVQVSTSTFNVNATQRLTIFRALSSTPDPGVVTIDFGGVGQLACEWSIAEFNNVNTTGENGAAAIGRTGTAGGGQDTRQSLLVTLGAFAESDNGTYGAFAVDAADSLVPGNGLSTIHSVTDATQSQALLTEMKLTEDNTVDASWATSTFAAAFAAEIVQLSEEEDSDSGDGGEGGGGGSSVTQGTGTGTIRVMQVDDDEDADFRVLVVTSNEASTVDVEVVGEAEDADYFVKVVTDLSLAEKFALVVAGEFDGASSDVVASGGNYSDTYGDLYEGSTWDDASITWDSATEVWND